MGEYIDYTPYLVSIAEYLHGIYACLLFIIGVSSAVGVLLILYNFIKKFI